ncbi:MULTISPECIES: iron-containing alcohol dehydrogenase [Anaerolinea]|uniref:iron-containing alcohol dehydrogenase n=1 Tax=Anaerolinea TaxID=233189 RepID=UPI00262F1C57|nr:iron-containing alcohol dehydrogenase [Anaerolinea thermophila]
MIYKNLTPSELSNSALQCPYCGKVHSIPFEFVNASPDVIHKSAPEVLPKIVGSDSPVPLLYDRAIEPLIFEKVIAPLQDIGLSIKPIGIGAPGILLDTSLQLAQEVLKQLPISASFLIGAGSGVICDLTKWIATQRQIDFALTGTAPSMNAYTSITATITEGEVKISHLLKPAKAVFLDVDVQRDAPLEMIWAGWGDLSARAVCNADWRLANFFLGTYFCPLPYDLTAKHQENLFAVAPGIAQREASAFQIFSDAILVSGYSMTVLNGETSPSSGAEHVLSHFWDFLTHHRGLPKNLHGIQVGIGTLIMLAFYEAFKQINPNSLNPERILKQRKSLGQLVEENQRLYGDAAERFNQILEKKYRSDEEIVQRVQRVKMQWQFLWEILDPYLTPFEQVKQTFVDVGFPISLDAVQRTREEIVEAMTKGLFYRPRYTLLDLAWELGVLEDLVEETLDRVFSQTR